MSHDLMHTLLEAGVPEPPPGLQSPPVDAIRSRARRRRAAVTAGAAVLLLVTAGGMVAARSFLDVAPARPTVQAATRAQAWTSALVSRDGRTVTVVSRPLPGSAHCSSTRVRVRAVGDPVVLTAPFDRNCHFFDITFVLDRPLGDRSIVDGSDNQRRTVFHERLLPRPTYPAGGAPDATGVALHNWSFDYHATKNMTIQITAALAKVYGGLPDGKPIKVHGRDMVITRTSTGYSADGLEQGWRITVEVMAGLGKPRVSRTQMQRVLDGLVWE
jgi:hypothetical protein